MTARVLVVGAGSIGARHARNLRVAGASVDVIDANAERASVLARELSGTALDPAALGETSHDGIVIASPTSLHVEQGLAALKGPAKLLIEKPLGLDVVTAATLSDLGADRVMVGYNLRLHRPNERLVDFVHDGAIGSVLAARFWFGSNLVDWRPTVDYRSTYSAQKSLGGGVLLDAIHELDLALWLMGPSLRVSGAVVERLGDLEIDVEDTVRALLLTDRGVPVSIELDYLSRRYRRGIEVIGTTGNIRLDWARGTIEIEHGPHVDVEAADVPVADSYTIQAERFLGWIVNDIPPPVMVGEGLRSVALAQAIRQCAS